MIDFHTHILPNQVEKMVRDYGNDGVFIDMFKDNQETSDNSKLIKSMSNSNIEASVEPMQNCRSGSAARASSRSQRTIAF